MANSVNGHESNVGEIFRGPLHEWSGFNVPGVRSFLKGSSILPKSEISVIETGPDNFTIIPIQAPRD